MSAQVLAEVTRSYVTTIRLDAGPGAAEPHGVDGALITWGTATLCTVLDYSSEFGTQELRDADEVFDPASMASAIGVPLTLGHPDPSVDEGLVTATTYREHSHGSLVEVARRGDEFRTRIVLGSRDAVDAYNSGVRELSMAYRSQYLPGAGTWNGPDGPVPYSGKQTKIRYNAIALVPAARAGHTARLDADTNDRNTTMDKITLRKKTGSLPAFVTDAVIAQAKAHKDAVTSGQVRADAIAVEEVTLRGSTMQLPTKMVDQIEMMITGEAAPSGGPTTPEPTMDEGMPPIQPDDKPRMDAKSIDAAVARALPGALAAALPRAIESAVSSQVQARWDAMEGRARTAALAAPLLGDSFDATGKDEFAIAACALVRVDSASRDAVERLAEAARSGDQRAAGRLAERLESAVRADAKKRAPSDDLAADLDGARQDAANADDEAAKAEKARLDAADTDPLDDARRAMNDRLSGKKPAARASA